MLPLVTAVFHWHDHAAKNNRREKWHRQKVKKMGAQALPNKDGTE